MEWLITTKARVDLQQLESKLLDWGCEPVASPPVPLDGDEQVLEVTGPRDLPAKARGETLILKLSPSSPMTLY